MRLILGVLVVAIAIGFAAGGRLGGLSKLRIRWAPLALVGLALQFFTPSRGSLPYVLLVASFALLAVFAAGNIKTPGFVLIAAGLAMNFLVIAVNHGMPVSSYALTRSGQQDTLQLLIHHGGEKHHLAGPGDQLLFLGDVTPIPPPIAQAVSAGDIVAYLGVGYVVIAAMRRDRRQPGTRAAPSEAVDG
jgi:hypothetical protein